ncbi:tetraprenyl-beta-curcumene synthase [Salinibacillus aidingensis]|uniref:Tetraprenyl-beta-curcumene synthase n=1 Tax=Salinibacillus aidingensis TaxID=237684 RepID=A0ABP3LGH9_9BACI
MKDNIPTKPLPLMVTVYRKIFPDVNKELDAWKQIAKEIPDQELRTQALASIESKTFHCEGGGIYALLASEKRPEAIQFIVAYQTISDYLDNLCDRSTSLDPQDFEWLHQSMLDALSPGEEVKNYYAYREEQNDGGYLPELVRTCQNILGKIENYNELSPYLIHLASLYRDLQVHKHVKKEERVSRLTNWFHSHQDQCPDLTWYEFSACTGSTLGVFCLVSYGLSGKSSAELADIIFSGYFPYLQGLHIMLDYYIDQKEDANEGDLNFCSFYSNEQELETRFMYIFNQTGEHLHSIPNKAFHQMVQKGLVGLYLADKKVEQLKDGSRFVKNFLKVAGSKAKFFYVNTKLYHKIKPALLRR